MLGVVGIINGVCYAMRTPTLTQPPRALSGRRLVAASLQSGAYVLAILRLPFGVLPYGVKSLLWFLLDEKFSVVWQSPALQLLRLVGDGVNFVVVTYWLGLGHGLSDLSIAAEWMRLILEKGQMLVSVVWQQLPHRALAKRLSAGPWQWARPYFHYYRKTDSARLTYLVRVLRRWSRPDPHVAHKLRYVRAFRMVEPACDLRTGQVRHVALGEIFIHPAWSNDPFLLLGLAVRRSPWLFDPRYLRRPFYYRTEANPRATRFVLEQAHFSPPFALYQFGHEIKAARFDLFYRACRGVGFNLEAPVQADGTYVFDPLLRWLAQRLGRADSAPPQALRNDADVQAAAMHQRFSLEQIAVEYTYPLLYVEEVLSQAVSNASTTTSGTSQCG